MPAAKSAVLMSSLFFMGGPLIIAIAAFPVHICSGIWRALLTHRAPTLDSDEKPLFRPRVQDAWERQVPVSDFLHSRPR